MVALGLVDQVPTGLRRLDEVLIVHDVEQVAGVDEGEADHRQELCCVLQGQGHTETSQIRQRATPVACTRRKEVGVWDRMTWIMPVCLAWGCGSSAHPASTETKGAPVSQRRGGQEGQEGWSAAAEPGQDLSFVSSAPHSRLHPAHGLLLHTRQQRDLEEDDPVLGQVCTPQGLRNRWEGPGKLTVIDRQTCKSPLSEPVSPQY